MRYGRTSTRAGLARSRTRWITDRKPSSSAATASRRTEYRPATMTTKSTSSMSASRSAKVCGSGTVRMASSASWEKPSWSGSVTATIWMTCWRRRSCTRLRTLASDRPTCRASSVYDARPSIWSAAMISLSAASRRELFRTMSPAEPPPRDTSAAVGSIRSSASGGGLHGVEEDLDPRDEDVSVRERDELRQHGGQGRQPGDIDRTQVADPAGRRAHLLVAEMLAREGGGGREDVARV